MKYITQIFIAFTALLVLPLALFGQAKSITSDEYYVPIREAYSKMDNQIRKKVQIYKSYTNGKVTKISTDTYEYLPPDKSRWVSISEKDGKVVKRIEKITIGNFIYEKQDNGAWVKRERNAEIEGPGGFSNSTPEFFIEETKVGKEKFRVLIMRTVNSGKTRFNENKTWINEKGFITKSSFTTSLNEPKNLDSTSDVTYDYKIKPPKIEPPVK